MTTILRKISPFATVTGALASKSGQKVSNAADRAKERVSGGLDAAGESVKKGAQKSKDALSKFGRGIKTFGSKLSGAISSGFEKTIDTTAESIGKVANKGRAVKEATKDFFIEAADLGAVEKEMQLRMSRIKDEAENMHKYLLSVYTQDGKIMDSKRYLAATQLWQELVTLSLYPLMQQHSFYGAQDDIAAYNIENARANKIIKTFIRQQREVNSRPNEGKVHRQFRVDDYMASNPNDIYRIFRSRSGKLLKQIDSREGFTTESFANSPRKGGRSKKGNVNGTRVKSQRGQRELRRLAI